MKDKTIELTQQFIRISNKWGRINARPIEVEQGFSVTPSEIHFVDAVWKSGGGNVTELAASLGVTKGAVSQMVGALTRKGLLEKAQDGNNKKTVLLRLTEKGERAAKFHDGLHEAINQKLAEVLAAFGQTELARACDMLARVEELFDGMAEQD